MRKTLITLFFLLITITAYAQWMTGVYSDFPSNYANSIFTDQTKFDGILASSGPTVQSALEVLDEINAASVPTTVTNFDNILSSSDDDLQTALETIDDAITSTVPTNSSTTCSPNQLAFESGFLYVCVASNTWERVAIATWAITDRLLLDDGSSHLLLDDGSSKMLIR